MFDYFTVKEIVNGFITWPSTEKITVEFHWNTELLSTKIFLIPEEKV